LIFLWALGGAPKTNYQQAQRELEGKELLYRLYGKIRGQEEKGFVTVCVWPGTQVTIVG